MGKKHVLLHEEKIQVLKGIPKISVIPGEMNLHHQEMNLEKQTGVKYEGSEKRGELWSFTIGLISLTRDIHEKQGPLPLGPPPGKVKEACPVTNGKQGIRVVSNVSMVVYIAFGLKESYNRILIAYLLGFCLTELKGQSDLGEKCQDTV